jgi:hypothetical protein
MFSCCCVNKKALKKAAAADVEAKAIQENGDGKKKPNDNNNSIKSPQKPPSTDAVASCKSPNDKSNSSDEDINNLSGLIMSDGLVGERKRGNFS